MTSEEKLSRHIRRCFFNHRDSQKFIYEKFYGYAKSICECYAQDHEEIVEMLNNCFLRIFKNVHQFVPVEGNEEDSFKNWLRKWIISGVVDHCRKHFKHDLLLDFKHDLISDPDQRWESVFAEMLPHINCPPINKISRITGLLSPTNRIILNLTVLEGFSHREMADCLNIPIETATGNVFKAMDQLQKGMLSFTKTCNLQ